MTDVEKIALADKILEKKSKQHIYTRWRRAKEAHQLAELTRLVKENDLTDQVEEFTKEVEDFE